MSSDRISTSPMLTSIQQPPVYVRLRNQPPGSRPFWQPPQSEGQEALKEEIFDAVQTVSQVRTQPQVAVRRIQVMFVSDTFDLSLVPNVEGALEETPDDASSCMRTPIAFCESLS